MAITTFSVPWVMDASSTISWKQTLVMAQSAIGINSFTGFCTLQEPLSLIVQKCLQDFGTPIIDFACINIIGYYHTFAQELTRHCIQVS